jgi:hypothetical protein
MLFRNCAYSHRENTMRPQTIGLLVASAVTGLFLTTVGLVLAWPILTAPKQDGFKLGADFRKPIFAQPDVQAANEQPLPQDELPNVRGALVPANEYVLSEPHTHGNLMIFLIHGMDTMKNRNILTLQEALDRNVAVVHDTGAVLAIDNRGNAPFFIQSGDIVKGGNQDRTVPYDMLVPAHSNRMPIAALCVEKGRSFPRGNERSTSFATSTEQLPGRQLKLAAYRQSQNEIWTNVRIVQDNLARNAGGSVQAPLSQTSLQLSLEHQRVQGAVQDYLIKLATSVEGKNDVIGYAAVVNGKIQSADVYASSAMFRKLWPKLIRASAVEAVAERQPGAIIIAPGTEAVQAFLADAENGQAFRVEANRSTVIRHETARAVLYDTCDPTQQNLVLHRSFLAK